MNLIRGDQLLPGRFRTVHASRMAKISLRAEVAARAKLPPAHECRAIREGSSVSLSAVADEVGVTKTAVWMWEQGRRKPRGVALIRYVRALETMRGAA